MHKLFQLEQSGSTPYSRVPNWQVLSDGLVRNHKLVVNYYEQYPQVVSSSHFLVRLLYAVNIGKSLPIERFYYAACARSLNTAMALKLTTSLSRGDVFDGVFYGKGSREVIIGHIDSFDYAKSEYTWRSLESVRVLHHPKSDLSMIVPDGRATSAETGLSVISINIPMLLVQYYHFSKEQDARESQGMARRSVMQFIYSYVLTNALKSHLDYAVFNRMYNMQRGIPMGESAVKHSFALINYSSLLDESLKEMNRRAVDLPYKFDAKMKLVPSIFSANMSELSKLPDMASTLQVFWALVTSRIKMLSFLVRANKVSNARAIGASEINNIQRLIRIQSTQDVMKNILGFDAWYDIASDVDTVMDA